MYHPLTSSRAQGAKLASNRYPIKKALHLLLVAALILAIVAGVDSDDSTKTSEVNALRRVSAILFLLAYIAFVLLHGYFWTERRNLQLHRRTVSYIFSQARALLIYS